MTHYETLGIEPTAEPNEIRKAYRRAAAACHPDREGGSDEAMKAVNLAFNTLIDPAKRKRYDETGDDADTPPGPDIDGMAQSAARNFLGRFVMESADPVKDARQAILSEKERISGVVSKARRDRNRLEARRKRVRGIEGNPLHQVIDGMMAGASDTIAEGERNIQVLEKALEVIGSIGYEPEPPPSRTATEVVMLASEMERLMRSQMFGFRPGP